MIMPMRNALGKLNKHAKPMEIREIGRQLAMRTEEIAQKLYPSGKRVGQEWQVGSVDGEKGSSLRIHLSGAKAGVWCDFAGGEDERGDLLDLIRYRHGKSLVEAIAWAKDFLHIESAFRPETNKQPLKTFKKPRPPVGIVRAKVDSPVMHYLTVERKLSPEIVAAFGIGDGGDKIAFPYTRNGEKIAIKYLALARPAGKKRMWTEADCEPCLFGWDTISPDVRVVTLCEGEINTMSLKQYGHDALGLPYGSGVGAKLDWIKYEYDRLERFETIYLRIDQDHLAERTTSDMLARLGRHRCRILEVPAKDPNECLQQGLNAEVIDFCYQAAASCDPAELRKPSTFTDDVVNFFYPPEGLYTGCHLPFHSSTLSEPLVFAPNEVTVWTGNTGSGKSLLLGEIALLCSRTGERFCIASMELKPSATLARIARQATGTPRPNKEHIESFLKWCDDKLWIYSVWGNAKPSQLMDVLEYCRRRYDVRQFVIDSLLKLGFKADDYDAQTNFVDTLTQFVNRLDCHVHLVAHPRKQEETRAPGIFDVRGSGGIMDLCSNAVSLWAPKQGRGDRLVAGDADVVLRILKHRNGALLGQRLALCRDAASLQHHAEAGYSKRVVVAQAPSESNVTPFLRKWGSE